MIINKYKIIDNEEIPADPMYRCLIESTKMPKNYRMIAIIYQEQRRKNPEEFGDVPKDFDEEKFLMTFTKEDLKEYLQKYYLNLNLCKYFRK